MPGRGYHGAVTTLSDAAQISRLVPFVHVADVEASLAFYALLGFQTGGVMRDRRGAAFWAIASTPVAGGRSGPAEIMFARADGPVLPEQQAVIFYMYCADVAALREHVLARGLHDGGAYRGRAGSNDGRRVAFAVSHPEYMKNGELRIADPDGYCILVGQLENK